MAKSKDINVTFPERLRECLDREGETQTKLAEYLGVKRQSVGYWKDGITAPDVNTLAKISEYYQVSADYLLGRAECKKRDVEEVHRLIGLSEPALRVLEKKKYSQTIVELDGDNILASQVSPKQLKKILAEDGRKPLVAQSDKFIKTLNALIENESKVRVIEYISKYLFADYVNDDTDKQYFNVRQKDQDSIEFIDSDEISTVNLIKAQKGIMDLKEKLRAVSLADEDVPEEPVVI